MGGIKHNSFYLGGGMEVTGVAGGQGFSGSNMLMTEYSYVYAFISVREPSGIRSYWKFSKLTLNNNVISEEVISELEELSLLGGTYDLINNYIRVRFWNDNGFSLLFGVK